MSEDESIEKKVKKLREIVKKIEEDKSGEKLMIYRGRFYSQEEVKKIYEKERKKNLLQNSVFLISVILLIIYFYVKMV